MRTTLILVVALALLLVSLPLAGCSSNGDAAGPAMPTGEWLLDAIQGEKVDAILPQGASRPTLNIGEDGRVSGMAGINRLSTSLDPANWARGAMDFGSMAVTRMAGPQPAMAFESRYLALLDRVESFGFDGDALVLKGDNSNLLRFVRGE